MKRIVFLIIASLLVLGLVLPGCGEAYVRVRPVTAGEIHIAVTGPMDEVQGEHHWLGATMARDEINALPGKITLDGTPHTLVLHKVNTNEVHGLPSEGVLALRKVIRDVDLVVGGFRTESVSAYRLEAMDEKVIFMNCGAATMALQQSVVTDYPTYKYWFKATPYNEIFLCTSMLKLTASAVASLVGTFKVLEGYGYTYNDGDYAIAGAGTQADPYVVKVAIIGEALSWCAGIVDLAQERLPTLLMPSKNITMDVVGTWLVSDKAPALDAEMSEIAAEKPHAIFTIFSGPVGKVYSKARADTGLPALSVGINVEGQLQSMATYTGDGCEYDIMLDTWGWGVNQTDLTEPFLTKFMSSTYANGEYPLYTAATYDAIYALKEALEDVGIDPDVMVAWLEDLDNAQKGAGTAKTAYYPMPDVTLNATAGLYALNDTQVLDYYPWLDGLVIGYDGATPIEWAYNVSHWTTIGGFVAHDTVYGPGYQTGLGTQWQTVGSELKKVGWWPMVALSGPTAGKTAAWLRAYANGPTTAGLWAAGLLDSYGFWNFEYDGTVPLIIPSSWWMSPP